MSLFQLVGGVAVAGAVAAGTTAFTAGSSLTLGSGVATTPMYGGASLTVVGAKLNGLVISSSTNDNDVDKITLTLKDGSNASFSDPTKVAVSAVVTGGGTAGAVGHTATCSFVSGDDWKCIPTTGGEVWNNITKINLVVTDA